MTAFVLGNGISRSIIDVDILKKLGSVYGCNALYRTHTVTALVATDRPIATEIQESGYSAANRFYTRRPMPNLGAKKVPQPYFGFSSGPIAAAIAAQDSNNRIYLLGYDMGPAPDGKFNNVYADTAHYKKLGSLPTFTGNWVKQLSTVMRDFPNISFVRVFGSTTADVPEFHACPNYQKLDMSDFVARINTPKDL